MDKEHSNQTIDEVITDYICIFCNDFIDYCLKLHPPEDFTPITHKKSPSASFSKASIVGTQSNDNEHARLHHTSPHQ